jgi:hypothetical protein
MPALTANSSLLLYGSKIYEVLQYYYAPSATALGGTSAVNTLYAFIGKVTPWDDPYNPPVPTQDQYSLKQVFKNIVAAKKITSADISPVLPRRDWVSGVVYDYYDDKTDMFPLNSDNLPSKNFYVRNRYDQVFKCLWNDNDTPSTVEPQLSPGTFDSTFLTQTSDGYKWKFLYSINAGTKQRFLDENWMPVPAGSYVPNPTITDAGIGSVDVINITTVGQGYDALGTQIIIDGDGYGANASPVVNAAGYLTDVVVTNIGSNYTYANPVISVLSGYNTPNVAAVAISPVSPVGGHGLDPISELGCNNVMISLNLSGSEGGIIPTDMTYYQLGLILDPSSKDTNPLVTFGDIFDVTTQLFVSPGTGSFVSGQTIYQGQSLATATFTATVASFNTTTNVVKVINTYGVPVVNQALLQDANGPVTAAVRTLLSYQESDFIIYSGYMTYIENRTAIQRSSDGTEQFRAVLRF